MMCVCDNLNWMKNGWMDWIEWMWMWMESGCGLSGCGCGKWRGSGSHTPQEWLVAYNTVARLCYT